MPRHRAFEAALGSGIALKCFLNTAVGWVSLSGRRRLGPNSVRAQSGTPTEAPRRRTLISIPAENGSLLALAAEKLGTEEARYLLRLQGCGGDTVSLRKSLITILKACSGPADLKLGRLTRSLMAEHGIDSDIFCGTALIGMYGRCGCLKDALETFSEMPHRNQITWNAMISVAAAAAVADPTNADIAFELALEMRRDGRSPDRITYLSLLKAFFNAEHLLLGKAIHASIVDSGFDSAVDVATAVVNMYGKCKGFGFARDTFLDHLSVSANVAPWNAVIVGCAESGREGDAFALFERMLCGDEAVAPNGVTLVAALKACGGVAALASLHWGKLIHAVASKADPAHLDDVIVGTALLNMYGKCGRVGAAQALFERLPERNEVSWNTLIAAYAQHGDIEDALAVSCLMRHNGVTPSAITYMTILKACSSHGESSSMGKSTHARIVDTGMASTAILGNALLSMYGSCSCAEDSRRIFERMPNRNTVSWNAMISVASQQGDTAASAAFELFQRMHQESVPMNEATYISVLNAFANPDSLRFGKLIHVRIAGYNPRTVNSVMMSTALVNMYGNCGNARCARSLFDRIRKPNIVSWNVMIISYAQNNRSIEALGAFHQMLEEGLRPNRNTFVGLLGAFSRAEAIAMGQLTHVHVSDHGFASDDAVRNALVKMYDDCRSTVNVKRMFNSTAIRNIYAWNAMITACAADAALKLFQQMLGERVNPTKVTYLSILNTVIGPAMLAPGKTAHCHIIDNGVDSDASLVTSLICMYGKCSRVEDSFSLLARVKGQSSVVPWNAMITVYLHHDRSVEALRLHKKMEEEGIKPDRVTFLGVLEACGDRGTPRQGKLIHARVVDTAMEVVTAVGNSLITMYGKCGSVDNARRIFEALPERTSVSWNAMLAVYAHLGSGNEVLELFERMQRRGAKADEVTLTSVLYACSHAGLIDEGRYYFDSMRQCYGIVPRVEHYNCLVDLLGRAGHINEAADVVSKMPVEPDAVTWLTLLGACKAHGRPEQGRHAAERLLQLDPQLDLNRRAMANKARKEMSSSIVKKKPGFSWIEAETNSRAHTIVMKDKTDPQGVEIYAQLASSG